MQSTINLDAVQVRPAGISLEEGMAALKSATKREAERLWHTESETFTALCDESVTYGEVVKATLGFAAFMAVVFFGGYLMGGVVA
nr:MAG TPA: hypothetical protein [Caudoviricetes sp.]